MTTEQSPRWLHFYATLVALATLLLIIAGALVTGNDAGLSVPDWPTSFGSFRMPRMVGGVLYEHGHRMIGATVGLSTVILAVLLWLKEPRGWVRWLGTVAVLAVILQGVLGGLTVLFFLPPPASVAHASLAQSFFCLTVSLAVFTRGAWRWDETKIEDPASPSLRRLAVVTTGTIFVQLMLGAAFRHNAVGIHPHLAGAGAVTLSAAWALRRVLTKYAQEPRLKRPAVILGALVLLQLFLGVTSHLMKLEARDAPQPLPPVVAVTTLHVAAGALALAASVVLTLYVYRLVAAPRKAPAIASAPQNAAI